MGQPDDDLDFGDLAKWERRGESARRAVRLVCPNCGEEFSSKKRSGTNATCPECGESVPVKRRKKKKKPDTASESKFRAWDETSSVSAKGQFDREKFSPKWSRVSHGLNLAYFGGLAINFSLFAITGILIAALSLFAAAMMGETMSMGLVYLFASVLAAAMAVGMRVVWMTAEEFVMPAFAFCGYITVMFICLFQAPLAITAVLFTSGIASLAGGLLVLIGVARCIGAPREANVGWMFLASLICSVLAVAGHTFTLIQTLGARNAGWSAVGEMALRAGAVLTLSAIFGAHFLLVRAMRKIGAFFSDSPTVHYISSYTNYFILNWSIGFVVCLLIGAGAISGFFAIFCLVINLAMSMVQVIWFLRSIAAARDIVAPYFRD